MCSKLQEIAKLQQERAVVDKGTGITTAASESKLASGPVSKGRQAQGNAAPRKAMLSTNTSGSVGGSPRFNKLERAAGKPICETPRGGK